MHHRLRLLLTTLITATALASLITNASATRLSISNRNIRATWTSLELSNAFNRNVVRCPVTLEGSFTEATIRKTLGALIGVISKASVPNASCTGGHATIHQETLPWRVTYQGFTGTLPRIRVVRLLLIGAAFEIETEGLKCNALTEEAHPAEGEANLNETTGQVGGLRAQPERRIPLTGGICGLIEGSFSGTGTVTLLGNTNSISVTLIDEGERLEPSPVSFGTVEPNELAGRTVTITAPSAGFTVNRISVGRGNYFAITDPNRCIGARLGSRATCAFKLIFVAPSESAREAEDTVTVETSTGRLTDTVSGRT